ncbi:DUF924 family protein [Agarivorans aestuarii]|uniref:DUF924 family protein n=1 Tax=Agarivorans aestuarii TaxID=1563703 RepID=A0ABU7G518_9ALTE|nr:DUF924 family protein [Agarivorans aestuarii]MEE1674416.1 DUF924 family protein [Agarivorans aestuarii]
MAYQEVLDFWFEHLSPQQWFSVDPKIDELINRKFSALLQQAACGELYAWREQAESSLAEIILLDQFSRNIHRGHAGAFANDSLALCLAQQAVAKGFDQQLSVGQRSFLYMPYMHSESLVIHQLAEQLFKAPGLEQNYQFELKHKVIIERFGRYPHRNQILGRESSAEEIAFLAGPDSSF